MLSLTFSSKNVYDSKWPMLKNKNNSKTLSPLSPSIQCDHEEGGNWCKLCLSNGEKKKITKKKNWLCFNSLRVKQKVVSTGGFLPELQPL